MTTQYVDGLSGEPFSLTEIDPKKHFCLNCEGQEIVLQDPSKEDDQLDSESIIFVYPYEIDKNPIERKPLDQILNKSSQKFFQVGEKDSQVETFSTKTKENSYIKKFYTDSLSMQERTERYAQEYEYQMKSLKAVARNSRNVMYDKFTQFVTESYQIYKGFTLEKKKLNKTTEKIFTDLVLKDINEGITNTSEKGKKKKTRLFDFVDLDEYNTGSSLDERKMLKTHHKKIIAYENIARGKIKGWQTIMKCVDQRFKNMEDDLNKLTDLGIENKSLGDYGEFKVAIRKSIEKIKDVLDNHSAQVERLKKENDEVSTKNILNEIKNYDHLDRLNNLNASLTQDMYKCLDHKFRTSNVLFNVFKVYLDNRNLMRKSIEENKDSLKELTKKVTEVSLRKLVFAANLPNVYEKGIDELIRRKKFSDELKRDILKLNTVLIEKCNKENEIRMKFLKEMEELLGYKIPADLIRGIYDYIKVPSINLDSIDKNLPKITELHKANKAQEDETEYEVMDYDEFEPAADKKRMEETFRLEEKNKFDDSQNLQIGITVVQNAAMKKERKMDLDMKNLINDMVRKGKKVVKGNTGVKSQKKKKNVRVVPEEKRKSVKIEEKVNPLEEKVKELEKQILNLKKNNDELKSVNEFVKKDKQSEISKMKAEYNREISSLKQEHELYQNEKKTLKQKVEKLTRELKERMNEQIKSLNDGKEKNDREKDLLKENAEKAWKEKEELEKKIETNEKLLQENKKMVIRMKSDFEKKEGDLTREIELQKELLKKEKNETDSLNKIIQPIIQERDKLQQKNKEAISIEKQLRGKLSEQFNENDSLRKDLRKMIDEKNKLEEKQRKYSGLVERQVGLISEKDAKIQTLEKELNEKPKKVESPNEQYKEQLKQLYEMGFRDVNKVLMLLHMHNGNQQKVLEELLKQNPQGNLDSSKGPKISIGKPEVYDKVLAFKQQKYWEVLLPLSPIKFYVHQDCVRNIQQNYRTILGDVIQIEIYDHRQKDPLKLKTNYGVLTMSIEKQF